MQGFCWYTTFTTWTHYFRWDSLSETAGLQGSAHQSNISWDSDGALSSELEAVDRAGDPNGEGVIWGRVAEIALVGALECGGFLVQLVLEELEESDQFDYVVVQATESSAGFYDRMGFKRVGAVAKYAPRRLTEEEPAPAHTAHPLDHHDEHVDMQVDTAPASSSCASLSVLSSVDVDSPFPPLDASEFPGSAVDDDPLFISGDDADMINVLAANAVENALPTSASLPPPLLPPPSPIPAPIEEPPLVAYRHWAYPDEDVKRIDSSIMMALRLRKGEVHRRILGDRGGIMAHRESMYRNDEGVVPPRGHNMPKLDIKALPSAGGGGGNRRCHPWLTSKGTVSHKKKRPPSAPSSPHTSNKRQALEVSTTDAEPPTPSRVTSKGRVVTPNKRFSWADRSWKPVISVPPSPSTSPATSTHASPSVSKQTPVQHKTTTTPAGKQNYIIVGGIEIPIPAKKPHRSAAELAARYARMQQRIILEQQQAAAAAAGLPIPQPPKKSHKKKKPVPSGPTPASSSSKSPAAGGSKHAGSKQAKKQQQQQQQPASRPAPAPTTARQLAHAARQKQQQQAQQQKQEALEQAQQQKQEQQQVQHGQHQQASGVSSAASAPAQSKVKEEPGAASAPASSAADLASSSSPLPRTESVGSEDGKHKSSSVERKTRKCPFTGVRIPIAPRNTDASRALFEPSTFADIKCMGCNKKTREKAMILCDRCDAGWHIFCMDPPLDVVPEGDWVCKGCKQKERKAQAKKRAMKAASTPVDEAALKAKLKGIIKITAGSRTRGPESTLGREVDSDRVVSRRKRAPVERFKARPTVAAS